MRKNFTPIKTTQPIDFKAINAVNPLSPSEESINKILQFAASYRVEKSSENHFIEYFLN